MYLPPVLDTHFPDSPPSLDPNAMGAMLLSQMRASLLKVWSEHQQHWRPWPLINSAESPTRHVPQTDSIGTCLFQDPQATCMHIPL